MTGNKRDLKGLERTWAVQMEVLGPRMDVKFYGFESRARNINWQQCNFWYFLKE